MEASFLKTATRKEHYPKSELPKIIFGGKSNVGKSSLINSLVGQKRLARTSSTPGRTQAINFFNINSQWIFVDLPGYGFAKAPKRVQATWRPMVEQLLSSGDRLQLAILIVDSRHPASELDQVMKAYIDHYQVPCQVVATKVDKLPWGKRRVAIERLQLGLQVDQIIPYSSATGIGKKKLWRIIREV